MSFLVLIVRFVVYLSTSLIDGIVCSCTVVYCVLEPVADNSATSPAPLSPSLIRPISHLPSNDTSAGLTDQSVGRLLLISVKKKNVTLRTRSTQM